ncbi:MAG: hypothetical protein LLG20_16010 [Acidobacteriales bacterium]|nr:hypothetical protein [Terriglobales bacterium]
MPTRYALRISLFFLSLHILSAAVDCRYPKNRQQRVVCATPELLEFDRQLSTVYEKALAVSSGSERTLLEREQGWWETYSGGCWERVDCIKKRYIDRAATLEALIARASAPPPVGSDPSGTTPTPTRAMSVPESRPDVQQPMPQQPSTTNSGDAQPGQTARPGEVSPLQSSGGEQTAGVSTPAPEAPALPEQATTMAENQPLRPSQTTSIPKHEGRTDGSSASPGIFSEIGGFFSSASKLVINVLIGCYVLWGAFWGCHIVYPRMMAWYRSSTWFILGRSPMDILIRQITFGLQVRFWAIVIGTIVGCLGGAIYMQFMRSGRTTRI